MANCASCSSENEIFNTNSGNKQGKFTETSRIIGTPINSYSSNPIVDIATLEMDGPVITSNPSYKISLQLIDIPYADFRTLFFKSNTDFEPNPGAYQQMIERYMTYVGFKEQVKLNDTGREDGSLNIYKEVVTHYEQDLGLPKNCWSSCSLNAINRFLGGQQSLFDVGGACKVACSLTLDQLFTAWEQQGVELSGNFSTPNNLRVPKANGVPSPRPVAVVTAKYKSITPGVSDIELFFPYAVNFANVTKRYEPENQILYGISESILLIGWIQNIWGFTPNSGATITIFGEVLEVFESLYSSNFPTLKDYFVITNPSNNAQYGVLNLIGISAKAKWTTVQLTSTFGTGWNSVPYVGIDSTVDYGFYHIDVIIEVNVETLGPVRISFVIPNITFADTNGAAIPNPSSIWNNAVETGIQNLNMELI